MNQGFCRYSAQGLYLCDNKIEHFVDVTIDNIIGKWDSNAIIFKTDQDHAIGVWVGIHADKPNFHVTQQYNRSFEFAFPYDRTYNAVLQSNQLKFNNNTSWNQLTPLNRLK